jgi:ubiquinone/menaquinone biosynthesis C-methylase UbiE
VAKTNPKRHHFENVRRRGPLVGFSQKMAQPENDSRPMGRYSDENWKSAVEQEGEYERRRFGSTAKGQEKNRREQEMVGQFLRRLPPGSRVLDVPAGMGRFTELIWRSGHEPVSIDLNFSRIAEARRRGPLPALALQADILRLPLTDQAVDAVVCFRLFHHLAPDRIGQVLRELRRVAPRAFVTFYCRHSFKFFKKRLRGKAVSGQYYSSRQMVQWSREAGWNACRHQWPFAFWQILHALDLEK